jgi:hypothetical protein
MTSIIVSAAAPARGKAILAISIRLKKSGPYAAWVIHCHKMGFFRDCRNSKTAGLGPPLVFRQIRLIC